MAQLNSLLVTGDSRFLNPINGNARNGIYYVKGTQTAATGAWTGNIPVPALYDGLTIMYYLPYAGSGNATLNLTLSTGETTGAKNCYYQGNTRLTTHYGVASSITMTYHPAGSISVNGTATTDDRWIAGQNYVDGNDGAYYDRIIYPRFVAGANKIFPYTIMCQLPDGRWESVVTSASVARGKAKNTHGFLLGQIALMYANATYNENAVIESYNAWWRYGGLIDHRYTFNTEANATYGTTANKPIYLVGTIGNDGLFYLADTWWTQTLPSSADSKIYIYIGDAFDTYRMTFDGRGKMFVYTNGAIRAFAQDAATVNGLTVQTAVPANAKFTDTTYTGTGAISVNSSTHVISTTAEVNQNAFSNVKVGSTTIAADSKTDTLELVAGDNVTLTPDATNDKVTIAATDCKTDQFDLTDEDNAYPLLASGMMADGSTEDPMYVQRIPYTQVLLNEDDERSTSLRSTYLQGLKDVYAGPVNSRVSLRNHGHGNIQNDSSLQTNDITIASGDKIVVTDSSDSNKIARTSISFDGSTTTKALTPKGTFETFSKTDTNNAVTQTPDSTTNSSFRLLFSNTADDTLRTEGSKKSSNLTYNPSTKILDNKGGGFQGDLINITGTAFVGGNVQAMTGTMWAQDYKFDNNTGTYRSVLDINSDVQTIAPAAVNVASGSSYVTLTEITLTNAGTQLIMATGYFASNSNKSRAILVTEDSSSSESAVSYYARASCAACDFAATGLNVNFIYECTTNNKTLWLRGRQNSGSTLSTNARIQAIRLF